MPMSSKMLPLLSLFLFSACSSSPAPGADPAPATSDTNATAGSPATPTTAIVVPAAQAQRGQNAFLSSCTACHSSSEFNATAFQTRWRNRTAADLLELTAATMPEDAPNSLPTERYVEIVAYILRLNGFESSSTEEAWDLPALANLSLASLGGQ